VKWIALLVVFVAAPSALRASTVEPERAGQESSLVRAVFSDGELWVLSDAGQLFRISEGRDTPVEVSLPEPALDLCQFGGRPAVITCSRTGCASWTLRQWDGEKWSAKSTLPTARDDLIALSCDANKVSLLTGRRFIELDAQKPRTIVLSEKLQAGLAAVHATQDRVFVGINRGEWGGGLRRIDRRTGEVRVVEHNVTGELCGGPLNTGCDPVNGIAGAPWRPGCVVVAVGLVHFAPHGRLVQVCGDRVERLYFKPYGNRSPAGRSRGKDDEPFETVAFFGLIREGETLWAAGIDGIYKAENGKVTFSAPLPPFKKVGGFHVSFALPEFVLVLTSVNQRRSISGNVPMMVPR